MQSVPRLPRSGEVASEMESNHKIDSCDGAIENQETIVSPEKVGGDYRDDFTPVGTILGLHIFLDLLESLTKPLTTSTVDDFS